VAAIPAIAAAVAAHHARVGIIAAHRGQREIPRRSGGKGRLSGGCCCACLDGG